MLNLSLSAVLSPGSDPTPNDPSDDRSESRLLSRDDLVGEEGPSKEIDDVYLFPEERVLLLLEEHDGRMWQGEVVDETGFSKAKVSKLLSKMEADGDVARYWKGGKKVVTLPELGPDSIC